VLEPEVLLLDEPLAALDAPTRSSMQRELGALIRGAAMAAVLVTHHRREALALGDRVAVMLDGRVRQIAPPDDLFSRPADLEVARFMGFENLLAAEADGAAILFPGGVALQRESGPDGPVTVCLRAEEVRLVGAGDTSAPGPNRLSGAVAEIAPSGDGYLVRIDIGALSLEARFSRAEAAVRRLEAGARCEVSIRPAALFAIRGTQNA
jgi:molybdate transport system ATP-binding protein